MKSMRISQKPVFRVFRLGCLLGFCGLVSAQSSVPADLLLGLSSHEFQQREAAEAAVLEWSKISPEPAKEELFKLSQSAEDPEVRARCLSVLRALVLQDYGNQGEGWIGISLMDDTCLVPGDGKLRSVIRVFVAMPGYAAANAGIQPNDLIVGFEKEVWHDVKASELFMKQVRSLKPRQKVNLKVLRGEAIMDVTVTLSRRPAAADSFRFLGGAVDFEASEQTAMENSFRQWLNDKKSRK